MPRARLTSIRLGATVGLVGCVALAACGGGGSSDKADSQTTTTTKASSAANDETTTTTVQSNNQTSGGSASDINFKTICDYATGTEMSAATGVSGLVGRSKGIPTDDDPAAVCVYDNPSSPTQAGVAFLSFDPTDAVSFSQQPNDHDLDGFEIQVPSAQDVAFGQQHPGMGRGVVTVSWVHGSRPVHFRMNETAADGAKTIAEAQKINAQFPNSPPATPTA
jgi:hypothetical protein